MISSSSTEDESSSQSSQTIPTSDSSDESSGGSGSSVSSGGSESSQSELSESSLSDESSLSSESSQSESSLSSLSSSSSSCDVEIEAMSIFEPSELCAVDPGVICSNAQNTYKRAKFVVHASDDHTVTVIREAGPVEIEGSASGLSDGAIFYVKYTGPGEGPYRLRYWCDQCPPENPDDRARFVEAVFTLDLDRERPASFALPREWAWSRDPAYWIYHYELKTPGVVANSQADSFTLRERCLIGLDYPVLNHPTKGEVTKSITKPYRVITKPERAWSGVVAFPLTVKVALSGRITVTGVNPAPTQSRAELDFQGKLEKGGDLRCLCEPVQSSEPFSVKAGGSLVTPVDTMNIGAQPNPNVTWTSVFPGEGQDKVECEPYAVWTFTYTGTLCVNKEAGLSTADGDVHSKGWQTTPGDYAIFRKKP